MLLIMALPASAAPGNITLASTSDSGTKGNGASTDVSLAGSGTKVAFRSTSTNLSPADTDTKADIYVKDLTTGILTLASTSSTGVKGNGPNSPPAMSPGGGAVAFRSNSTNLVPADTDKTPDMYVKNLTTGNLLLASTSDQGVKGNSASEGPSISADGTKVAFRFNGTNLDPGDTDTIGDIYVKDLTTGDITLASTSSAGVKSNGLSYAADLSGDGTKVAFVSYATNLDPADRDAKPDIYIKDLVSGRLTLASTSAVGAKGNGGSFSPSLSRDGSRVAFRSSSTNLDPGDSDTTPDVYVKDLSTGRIILASTSDTGTKGTGSSFLPIISQDGTAVTFRSDASNLDPADTDTLPDVYVKILATNNMVLASTSDGGVKGNGGSFGPWLSADGSVVGFRSDSTNLDPGDKDTIPDVYVKELSGS
jgi:outer membrane protein OmpA-like peptidoglycan-associated protein